MILGCNLSILEGTPIPRELRPVAGDLAKKLTFDEGVQGNFTLFS